jgi:hypothetical protein
MVQLRATGWTAGARFLAGGRDFSLLHTVQTSVVLNQLSTGASTVTTHTSLDSSCGYEQVSTWNAIIFIW